jgi:hypothetical protein
MFIVFLYDYNITNMKKTTFYCVCAFLLFFILAITYMDVRKTTSVISVEAFSESQANIAYKNKAAVDQATKHICSNKKLQKLQEQLQEVSSQYYEEKENTL